MFKNSVYFLLVFSFLSCSKTDDENNLNAEIYVPAKYDTIAKDSFSTGAISVDIAAQIRKSSVVYQDSLRKAQAAAAIAKKDLEDKKKMEDLEKKKVEAEKKKTAETKAEL